MIAIGIIFLVLFSFFSLVIAGSILEIRTALMLMMNRQNEIIKEIKNSNR